ncbi:uncharacterized protein LOC142344927 [Convolutriloba macropyga]|uniref:uncharacterized protein LOC142344927 n=1 Tax=Convolutriloba macropyga TaxID=536237 RepID=UPI003F521A8A
MSRSEGAIDQLISARFSQAIDTSDETVCDYDAIIDQLRNEALLGASSYQNRKFPQDRKKLNCSRCDLREGNCVNINNVGKQCEESEFCSPKSEDIWTRNHEVKNSVQLPFPPPPSESTRKKERLYKKREAHSVSRTPLIQARPIFRSEIQIEPQTKTLSFTPTLVRKSQILYPNSNSGSQESLRQLSVDQNPRCSAGRSCSSTRWCSGSLSRGRDNNDNLASKRFSVAAVSNCSRVGTKGHEGTRPCSIVVGEDQKFTNDQSNAAETNQARRQSMAIPKLGLSDKVRTPKQCRRKIDSPCLKSRRHNFPEFCPTPDVNQSYNPFAEPVSVSTGNESPRLGNCGYGYLGSPSLNSSKEGHLIKSTPQSSRRSVPTRSVTSNLLLAPATSKAFPTLPQVGKPNNSPRNSPLSSAAKFSTWYAPRNSRRPAYENKNLSDLFGINLSTSKDVNNLVNFLRGQKVGLLFVDNINKNGFLYVGADLMKLDNPHEEINFADTGGTEETFRKQYLSALSRQLSKLPRDQTSASMNRQAQNHLRDNTTVGGTTNGNNWSNRYRCVTLSREKNEELGMRIQKSGPVVVTEVKTEGAANRTGIHVGDMIAVINGEDVWNEPHGYIAQLLRNDGEMSMIVASPVSYSLNNDCKQMIVESGYLFKHDPEKGWLRWFCVLKENSCLYAYRTASELIPSIVVPVTGCIVERSPDTSKPFSFQIINTHQNNQHRSNSASSFSVHSFHTSVDEDFRRWMRSLTLASKQNPANNIWNGIFNFELNSSAGHIMNSECNGFITISSSISTDQSKSSPNSGQQLSRKCYCSLKDAVIYCYEGIDSQNSDCGILLHGYSISNEADDLTALLMPVLISSQPPIMLQFSSTNEKHRWTYAIRSSLQCWMTAT